MRIQSIPRSPGDRPQETTHHVILFVAEGEPHSFEARRNLDHIFHSEPGVHFDLQVVNVLNNFELALEHQVLVTPCLIQLDPPPKVMIAGTLSDADKVRAVLGLNKESKNDLSR